MPQPLGEAKKKEKRLFASFIPQVGWPSEGFFAQDLGKKTFSS